MFVLVNVLRKHVKQLCSVSARLEVLLGIRFLGGLLLMLVVDYVSGSVSGFLLQRFDFSFELSVGVGKRLLFSL